MSRALSFLTLLTLALGLTAPGPALAQQNQSGFGEGTHYLRAIINTFNLKPIPQGQLVRDMVISPEKMLLIVLGQTAWLERFQARELMTFVRSGGALLVASDQESPVILEGDFGVGIANDFLVVPAGSNSAYKDLTDCPIISDFAESTPPIFRGITSVATNRPGHLVRVRSRVPMLAWFPSDAYWEDAGKRGMPRKVEARQWAFAAGGALGKGKVLVISDHSVFINDMLRQPDNENLTFAYNCINWLTDHGHPNQRSQVCLIEDGKVVTNFNVTLKEPPPPILPPLPPEELLIDKGNEILAGLDDGDVFNRFINERIRPNAIFRTALLIGTSLLCLWGLWRLTNNRHRFDRNEPELAACLADSGTHRPLVDWRNESLLRQNNCWEVAHQQARQCFASLLETQPGTPPQVTATGSWWQRRKTTQMVLRLWRLASGRYPDKITASGLRQVEDELRAMRAAVANGSLQLTDGARTA